MDVGAATEVAQQGSSLLVQIGVGGTFAIVILKTVFDFVSKIMAKRNGNGSSNTVTTDMFVLLRSIEALVKELHGWHDAKDEDHVFVWYTRKSLERHISKLADAVEKISGATEKQSDVIAESLGAILDDLTELKQKGHGGD